MSLRRVPHRALPLRFASALCLVSGCIGVLNGYMADTPNDTSGEVLRRRPFPALAADGYFLAHVREASPNPIGRAVFTAVILADLPVSAAVDVLFLPVRLIALAIHGPVAATETDEQGPHTARSDEYDAPSAPVSGSSRQPPN